MASRPPRLPLLPSTTLFRSLQAHRLIMCPGDGGLDVDDAGAQLRVGNRDREAVLRAWGERLRSLHASAAGGEVDDLNREPPDRKSTRLNSSHGYTSYAVFCL